MHGVFEIKPLTFENRLEVLKERDIQALDIQRRWTDCHLGGALGAGLWDDAIGRPTDQGRGGEEMQKAQGLPSHPAESRVGRGSSRPDSGPQRLVAGGGRADIPGSAAGNDIQTRRVGLGSGQGDGREWGECERRMWLRREQDQGGPARARGVRGAGGRVAPYSPHSRNSATYLSRRSAEWLHSV